MKTKTGLPPIVPGMRLEWRVQALTPPRVDALTNRRSHSQCLVASDGAEIATIAKDAVPEVEACLT